MMASPRKKSNAGATVAPILDPERQYTMPSADTLHEGTWLQWPHNYGWDPYHAEKYDSIWVAMTKALVTGENVHIIVFDEPEKVRVQQLLSDHGVSTKNRTNDFTIDFHIMITDDVWIRDNGPIFVRDDMGRLLITDWRFNGWGNKEDYWWSNGIPDKIGRAIGMPVHAIPMVLEGGSIQVDGQGTLMAKKSSILNDNRNPGWKQSDVEDYFRRYLGVTHFIWLNGIKGGDITDDHIDFTARFAIQKDHSTAIVTTERADFETKTEYDVLVKAKNAKGQPYDPIVHLPLTQRKVRAVQDYGTYLNYYVGNKVVLVPAFDGPNDSVAASILQKVYPDRKVVLIPHCALLFKDGGLVHCATLPQPAAANVP
ncbi:hypothetical protein ACA910_016218 [Epithemia clementina (nom. ined.)]